MDIELKLRERLVLRDPGPRFTDDVLSKLGDVPDGTPRNGVVQLSEARRRQRGRRLLLGVVVVVAAAAATLPFMHGRSGDEGGAELVMPVPPIEEPLAGDLLVTDAVPEPSAPAASLADCVDPHVLFGLLLPFETAFKAVSTPPAELGALQPPRELTWLGGAEHVTAASSTHSAVYRTSLPREAARAAMATVLVAAGWKAQPAVGTTFRNIFVSSGLPGMGETYCREGTPVTLDSRVLEGVTYVVLSRQTGAGFASTCDRPVPQIARTASPLDEFLPQLELPLDPATGRPVAMRGGGGGSSAGGSRWNRRSDVSFRSKESLDSIAGHFASQLAAQGWRPDASWSGAVSAGSTWISRADDDTLLEGALQIAAFGNDRYTVAFRAGQVN